MSKEARSFLPLVVLLLAAFWLRLYRLDAQSLWWDEGISLHLATSSAAEIVRDRLANIHPPLYFFLLKGWLRLVGVSPFTGRALSVLAGLLQVALAFAAAGYWSRRAGLGPRIARAAGWLAGGLMLLSPLSVIYSQEMRVYALLPVAYLLLLLLAGRWLAAGSGQGWPRLWALAAVAWLGLHLHYIALFAVAYVGAWGALVLLRRGDGRALRRWLLAHAVVAVASLPWLLAVLANWPAVRAEAAAGTYTTEPAPLPFLLAQVWTFHLTGLAGSLGSPLVRWLAAGAAIALGLSLAAVACARRRTNGVALLVAAHWAVPLLGGLFVWSVRSFSHPRYVVIFAALLIPLAAVLAATARAPLRRVPAALLTLGLVALSGWGLRAYFFDPAVAKPDVRGAAGWLEATAAPDDLILVPDTDWSLPFEYRGPTPVVMPAVAESPHDAGAALVRALDCTGDGPCARSGRVFVLDYPRGTRDWAGRLPFELERRGRRVATTEFDAVKVSEYRLAARPGPLPTCDAPDVARPPATFGPLRLEGAWLEQVTPSNTAVAVALCWRALEPAAANAWATLVLRDPLTGVTVAQTDTRLVNTDGAPARFWQPGDAVLTFHVLPLPLGTPPVTLQLFGGVYTVAGDAIRSVEAVDAGGAPLGRLLPLGEVALASPAADVPVEGLPAGAPLLTAAGLRLLSARIPDGPVRPGQVIRAELVWQGAGGLPDMRPVLSLEADGVVMAANDDPPAQGRYPTDRWAAGEVVAEVRDVRVPGHAAGTATLVVTVAGERVGLGGLDIAGAAAQFESPAVAVAVEASFGEVIRLVGFDPPPVTIDAARPLPITLYWQALSGEIGTGYTVFVHLLASDGRLIAQADSPPAGGARPTNEWLAGEYVSDTHELAWRETDYRGPARLVVGLYDPISGLRLPTAEGDLFELPVTVTIAPTP